MSCVYIVTPWFQLLFLYWFPVLYFVKKTSTGKQEVNSSRFPVGTIFDILLENARFIWGRCLCLRSCRIQLAIVFSEEEFVCTAAQNFAGTRWVSRNLDITEDRSEDRYDDEKWKDWAKYLDHYYNWVNRNSWLSKTAMIKLVKNGRSPTDNLSVSEITQEICCNKCIANSLFYNIY